MGLFKKTPPPAANVRGGCSDCDMRGPKRPSLKAANRDAAAHGARMHGRKDYRHLYTEMTD